MPYLERHKSQYTTNNRFFWLRKNIYFLSFPKCELTVRYISAKIQAETFVAHILYSGLGDNKQTIAVLTSYVAYFLERSSTK